MLSRDLEVLVTWFREVRDGRAEFTAAGAQAFETALGCAAEVAKSLEILAGVPEEPPPAPEERPANVVPFVLRSGVRTCLPFGEGGRA